MKTKLIGKEEVAAGTMAFHLQKPEGFSFRAGNTIDVTIEDHTYTFSIASAPHEPTLMIAMRMRDTPFKRALRDMPIGAEIEMSDSMGVSLHNDVSKKAVFLTGGIGVTLVRSILVDCAHRKTAHRLVLFSSNHTVADAPFLAELTALRQENSNYTFVPTMTQDTSWSGERGHIDAAMIARYVPDTTNTVWYLTGPNHMVKGLRATLAGMGIDEDSIKTEEFSGY